MLKRSIFALILGCFTIFLASCSTKTEPKDDAPPPVKDVPVAKETPKDLAAAKSDMREVKLHVDGMSEKLNLT